MSDLVTNWPITDNAPVDYKDLIELIQTTSAPNTWDHEHSIQVDKAHLQLTIAQTKPVHGEIKELMNELRKVIESAASLVDNGHCCHCGKPPLTA